MDGNAEAAENWVGPTRRIPVNEHNALHDFGLLIRDADDVETRWDEEAYDYMVDSLSSDGFVEDTVIENAILTAKKMLGVSKPVSPADMWTTVFFARW